MLKRFLSYYKPHKKLFALDMAASLIVSVIAQLYPILTRSMLNDLIPNAKWRMVVVAGLVLLALYVVRMLLYYFIQYQGHVMGVRMQAQMRRELFDHLEKLPFSYFDENETGKIMTRMTNDLFEVSELAHHGPENIIICTISVVLAFGYLAYVCLPLALIVFACVPLLVVCCLFTRKRMLDAFRKSREATGQINADIQSSISGIRITKAFDNAEKEAEKFEVGNTLFQQARKKAYHAMGLFHSSTIFITDVFNVVVLVAGGFFLYQGRINFADYSAFIVSVNLFLTPVKNLISFMEQFQNGVTGFERFVEIMDLPVEEDDPDAVEVDRVEGEIRFAGVSYGYDEEQEVLRGIDLHIPKGSTFALVGPSGGGKTTICHLIPRFYELGEGDITIDGRSIRQFTRASLRRNIGIVQQDIFLFNASIRDNILYGKLDATQEEVEQAAKRANIHDYIMTLDEGYDTVVGERGVRLSGGQKQRICIARVFLKNPPILILDEATSALDNTTEIQIQQALDELCVGRTTLVVAHRLSTIKRSDEIAVIDAGRIAEQGSHADLVTRGGIYSQLYQLQFRERLED